MDEALKKIKDFADKAHGDQKRKYTPERYIVHPVRVMEICKEYTNKLPILAAALLHDVIEDTPKTKNDVLEFLKTIMDNEQAEYTTRLVDELTDVYVKDKFPNWNRRKRKAFEADRIEKTVADSQTVKYADIIDNCIEIIHYETDFADLFLKECRNILQRIPKGDPELYIRVVKTVDSCLDKLHEMMREAKTKKTNR